MHPIITQNDEITMHSPNLNRCLTKDTRKFVYMTELPCQACILCKQNGDFLDIGFDLYTGTVGFKVHGFVADIFAPYLMRQTVDGNIAAIYAASLFQCNSSLTSFEIEAQDMYREQNKLPTLPIRCVFQLRFLPRKQRWL